MTILKEQALANKQHYFIDVSGVPEETFQMLEMSSDDFGLSKDYRMSVTAIVQLPVDLDKLIGKSICVSTLWEGARAYWHGQINEVTEQGISHDGEQVLIVFNSPLNILRHSRHNRVFREVSSIDIAKQLISEAGITQNIQVQGTAEPKPFVVQYEEDDYEFITRILAHDGFFFTFKQHEQDCDILISNSISELSQELGAIELPYIDGSGQTRDSETIFAMTRTSRLLTDSLQLNDYNYEQPNQLHVQSRNQHEVKGVGQSYLWGENYKQVKEGEQLVKIRQESLDWQRQTVIIDCDCRGLQPGQQLTISNHPEWSGHWVVVNVEHAGNQLGALKFGNIASNLTYRGQATLIPSGVPFRAPVQKKRPILGTFNATIASPLDEQGRYELQLGFDLQKNKSPAMRLMQPYGGSNHGIHFPYSEGTEVLVTCENGDPDRPIILGAVYNSEAASPVTSNNPTQNVLTTKSGHQLIMDDKRESPQIKLHTNEQKNRIHMDATNGAHQVNLVSEEGEVKIESGTHMTFRSGKDQQVQIANEHSVVVGSDQKLMTEQGSIEYQSANKITMRAESNIEWHSVNGSLSVNSGEDIAIESEQDVRLHCIKGNVEWVAEDGDLTVSANANLTIKSSGGGVIQIAQGNGAIEIDSSGNLIIDAPKVEINAENISLKASAINNN
jgi:type VI secretion system secreted protein VgrG